jgi:hypothetical protein
MPIQPTSPSSAFYSSRTPARRSQQVNSAPPIEEEFRRVIEINKCKADPVYFITNYLYIFETRPEFGEGFKLFKLWPKQVEYIRFLEIAYKLGWREVLCEKCRDMGASLLTLAWIFWHWLFDKNFNALLGTLTEDKLKLMPGHDTQFAKLRDFLENLEIHSPWILPPGFDRNQHLTSTILLNPLKERPEDSGNTIRGELATENFGRGPRASVCFRDESAFWNVDTSENSVRTAQLSIDVSSVNGMNYFHYNGEACASYEPSRKFVFDWWENLNFLSIPNWYENEKARAKRKGAAAYAKFQREVDRNKKAIAEGLIYPLIENVARGEYEFNPDFQTFCIWDYGYADMGVMAILQRDPDTSDLYVLEEAVMNRVGVAWFVPFVPGAPPVLGQMYHYLPEDLEKINRIKTYRPNSAVRHYGDKTGDQHTAAQGKSVFDVLFEYKIKVKCGPGWRNMDLRQNGVNGLLSRLHIHNRCDYFHTSFTQFSVPKRQENSQATSATTKGVHTWSHFPSALEAFAISEPPLDFDKPADPVLKENRYQVAR